MKPRMPLTKNTANPFHHWRDSAPSTTCPAPWATSQCRLDDHFSTFIGALPSQDLIHSETPMYAKNHLVPGIAFTVWVGLFAFALRKGRPKKHNHLIKRNPDPTCVIGDNHLNVPASAEVEEMTAADRLVDQMELVSNEHTVNSPRVEQDTHLPRSPIPSFINPVDRQILEDGLSRIEGQLQYAQSELEFAAARFQTEKASRHALQKLSKKLRGDIKGKDMEISELRSRLVDQNMRSCSSIEASKEKLQEREAEVQELLKKIHHLESNEHGLKGSLKQEMAVRFEAHTQMEAIKDMLSKQVEESVAECRTLQGEVAQLKEQLRDEKQASLLNCEELRLALEGANLTIAEHEGAENDLQEMVKTLNLRIRQAQTQDDLLLSHRDVKGDLHGVCYDIRRLVQTFEGIAERCERVLGRPGPAVQNGVRLGLVQEGPLTPTISALLPFDDDEEVLVAPYGGRSPIRIRHKQLEKYDSETDSGEGSDVWVSTAVKTPLSICYSESETGTETETEDDGISDLFDYMSEAEEEAYKALWALDQGEPGGNTPRHSTLRGSRLTVCDSPENWRAKEPRVPVSAQALRALLEAQLQENMLLPTANGSGSSPVATLAEKDRGEVEAKEA